MADEKLTRTVTKDNSLLKREEHPLPEGRSAIATTIQNLLDRGGVQRIIVEVDKPIRIDRWVPKDPNDQTMDKDMPVPETAGLSLFRLATSEEGELADLEDADEEATPEECLFLAFQQAGDCGYRPLAIYANNEKSFRKWLKKPRGFFMKTILGVEMRYQTDVPEDTIMLIAGEYISDEPGKLYSVCIRTGAKKELSYVGEQPASVLPPGDLLTPTTPRPGGSDS